MLGRRILRHPRGEGVPQDVEANGRRDLRGRACHRRKRNWCERAPRSVRSRQGASRFACFVIVSRSNCARFPTAPPHAREGRRACIGQAMLSGLARLAGRMCSVAASGRKRSRPWRRVRHTVRCHSAPVTSSRKSGGQRCTGAVISQIAGSALRRTALRRFSAVFGRRLRTRWRKRPGKLSLPRNLTRPATWPI